MANTAQSEADPSDDGPSPDLTEYRQSLVAAEQTMQGEYDKGVLTLSGGALGISLVFLKDVVGPKPLKEPGFLLASWIVWGLSIGFVLASYLRAQKPSGALLRTSTIKPSSRPWLIAAGPRQPRP